MTHRLTFTGTCDEAEFRSRCAEHDFWYHSYYFDNGFEQRGDYDIGRDLADYRFGDVAGLRVLDVGTGSGWFATYLEQQGADVTTVDVRGYGDFDVFGRPGYVEPGRPPDRDGLWYSTVSKGFWIMRDILGLRARGINSRVYDLSPELLGTFDLVFMGAVLMHVRDPIGALMACRSVCHDRLLATSFVREGSEALQVFSRGDPVTWWTPTEPCARLWVEAAGFSSCETGTVHLSIDSPAVVDHHCSAAEQTHLLLDARI